MEPKADVAIGVFREPGAAIASPSKAEGRGLSPATSLPLESSASASLQPAFSSKGNGSSQALNFRKGSRRLPGLGIPVVVGLQERRAAAIQGC